MPTIFDLLYREYCRARLAEMRKQLLIQPESHEVSEANCDASRPECAADQGSSRLGDSRREAGHRRLLRRPKIKPELAWWSHRPTL